MHESYNITNRFYQSIDSNKYDAVWLSRQLIVGYPSFELLLRKPIVYDIDDAIFLNGKASYYQFRKVAERAAAVVTGNEYLAEVVTKYNKNVYIVPTAVDTDRWLPSIFGNKGNHADSDEFRVGWSGTSSSFRYFNPIQLELKQFFQNFPSARLHIMSDRFPQELDDLKPYIEFVNWTQDNEVGFVQSLDVGLMPISDDLWSKGKCAYKMLLYAACGIPVIATPTGVNEKLLKEAEMGLGPRKGGDWYESLSLLSRDRSMCGRLGLNGAGLVRDRYSVKVCAPIIGGIFKRLS